MASQSSLDNWCRAPRGGAAQRWEDRAELVRTRCEALGLPYPRPAKRDPGKPSRQLLWEEALYDRVYARPDDVPEGLTRAVPSWWKRGRPLVRPPDEEAKALVIDAAPAPAPAPAEAGEATQAAELEAAAAPAVAEAPVEVEANAKAKAKAGVKRGRGRPKKQAVGQKARRAWRVVPQPFKDWLLDYQAHMYELEGWDSVRCLRHAQELCPEVFGHVLPSVPRRWVHSRDLASDAQHGGRRHCKVSPAARSVLLELAHKVSSKVAMNTFILKELFNKRLRRGGSPAAGART